MLHRLLFRLILFWLEIRGILLLSLPIKKFIIFGILLKLKEFFLVKEKLYLVPEVFVLTLQKKLYVKLNFSYKIILKILLMILHLKKIIYSIVLKEVFILFHKIVLTHF
jgi:hypothetical protein